MELLQQDAYIYVLHNNARFEWHLQHISLAVEVICGSRILIRSRSLTPDQCLGLREEIVFMKETLGVKQGKGAATEAKSISLSMPVHQRPSTSGRTAQARVEGTSGEGKKADPAQFPAQYICDMAQGLSAMQGLSRLKKEQAFAQHFPLCQYKHSTVGAALTIHKRAITKGLIPIYLSYGRTPQGSWKALVKEVNCKFI